MSFQQRVILAVLLCVSIMLVFDLVAPRPQPEVPSDVVAGDTDTGGVASSASSRAEPAAADEPEPPSELPAAAAPQVEAESHRLANERMAITLSNESPHRRGMITGLELLDDKFQGHALADDALALGGRGTLELSFADESTDFRLPRDANFEIRDSGATHLTIGYRAPDVEIVEKLELLDGQQARLTVAVTNTSASEQVHRLHARVRIGEPQEQSRWDIHRGLCRRGEDLEDEDIGGVEEGPARFDGPILWGGVDSKYFATLVVPDGPFAGCQILAEDEDDGRWLVSNLTSQAATVAPGATQQYVFGLFLGIKDFEALRDFDAVAASGVDLSQAIDWGWFGAVNEALGRPLLWLLRWFYGLTGVWGVAILLLTVVVKLATLPLTLKQMNSMKRMKEIQPEIAKLKEKYGSDRTKQGQELQALFARSGVNPLAGCLPMLVQFPVWIALYTMLSTAIDLVHEPFLWLPDLTAQDPFYVLPLGIGGLMFLQQQIMPQTAMDPTQAKMMKWMMPGMFTFFMLFLPSGLGIYIFANVLLSLVQSMIQVGSSNKAEATTS